MASSIERRLPGETLVPARGREVAWVYGLPLILFLVVNAGLVVTGRTYTTVEDYCRSKWRLLDRPGPPVDWLVVGDSSGSCGVDSAALGRRLGGSVLNLCTSAPFRAIGDAWMTDRYITRHGAPRQVVMVHAERGLDGPMEPDKLLSILARLELPWGAWERFDPPLGLSARDTLAVWVRRYWPAIGEDPLRMLRLSLPGRPAQRVVLAPARADGFTPVIYQPPAFLRAAPEAAGAASGMAPLTRAALDRLAGLAARHGIRIYLAYGPLVADRWELPAYPAYHAQIDRQLRTWAAAHPWVTYLPEVRTFPRRLMQNDVHAMPAAAADYTQWLADAIARAPAPAVNGGARP